MKRIWFLYFFKRSVSQRKGRIAIASASVALAIAVVTGMVGITAGIREKLGGELRAYGANIIAIAGQGTYLSTDNVASIGALRNVEEASGQLFASVQAGNRVIEMIGLDIDGIKGRGWRLEGKWPGKGEVLAGVNLKAMLDLKPGKKVSVTYENNTREFAVTGFIERGGAEDNSLVLSLEDAWALTGLQERLSTLLVRGRAGELDGVVGSIRHMIPAASVKTLRQVAHAEESILMKIQLLMALVTIVVLMAAAISVGSTMGANVIERREEIGLMKAIGATRRGISLFYLTEAVVIGFCGGAGGFILGYLSAQMVSKGAFNSFVGIPGYLPAFSLATGLAVSLIASHFPVRDAMGYNPAVILRGE